MKTRAHPTGDGITITGQDLNRGSAAILYKSTNKH